MKQIPITYQNETGFAEALERLREQEGDRLVFQIFSESLEEADIAGVTGVIEQIFPGTPWFGCSTSGNIVNCQAAPEISVTAIVFEKPTTRCEVFQYHAADHSVEEVTAAISAQAAAAPWLKAIEFYFTIPHGSYTAFCNGVKNIREDVQMFGGVSCSGDITSDACCVFSSAGGFSRQGIIAVFYGGDAYFVDSVRITGWKPLGRKFTVTKSKGSIVQELDGIPAYDVYQRYLRINNDENFFYNTLEFPLFYEHDGTTILRVPTASNEDRSITVSSDIEVGSTVRISYGDPKTIVESISEDSEHIRMFAPDLLHIFSCAARKTFWAGNASTFELESFRDIAPSAGFFSHGEFLRHEGCLNQHNVTLVIAAMREGEAEVTEKTASEPRTLPSRIPLVSRLATFISATSLELEEMNARLETANRNLLHSAITDGLTGLYNRAETQRRIEQQLTEDGNVSLIMLDIDNFKQVNDTYGHQEGDAVILALANILRNNQTLSSAKFSAGRWGGEEFMLVLADTDVSAASLIAELIRQCFANTSFPVVRPQTVSIGVTQAAPEDTSDSLCSRVDAALYKAKKTGKNKVIAL